MEHYIIPLCIECITIYIEHYIECVAQTGYVTILYVRSKMSEPDDALDVIVDAIHYDYSDDLLNELDNIDFVGFTLDKDRQFLDTLLTMCMEEEADNCASALVINWKSHPGGQPLSLLESLILDSMYDVELLAFCRRATLGTSAELKWPGSMERILHAKVSTGQGLILRRAFDVLGPLRDPSSDYADDLQGLIDVSKSAENSEATDFLLERLSQLTDRYAEIPGWIIVDGDTPDTPKRYIKMYRPDGSDRPMPTVHPLPEKPGVVFELPDTEATIKELLEYVHYDGEDDLSLANEAEIREMVELASGDQRREMLLPIRTVQRDEEWNNRVDVYRILGPRNPLLGARYEQFEESDFRMFTSTLFDYDEDLDEAVDRYDGECDRCKLKIRSRYHAVRLPLTNGGWAGWFHSFQCMEDWMMDNREENPLYDDNIGMMMNLVEEDMYKIGVWDRNEE